MHPELIYTLGKERHAELLRQNQFRHHESDASSTPYQPDKRPVRRVRRSLGTALVLTGARLLGGPPAAVDLFEVQR